MTKAELKKILDDHRQFILTIGVYGKEAHFEGVDFQGVDFENVDLSLANFKGAVNLTCEQLCKAKTLYNAKLPEDFEKKVREKCPELFNKPEN